MDSNKLEELESHPVRNPGANESNANAIHKYNAPTPESAARGKEGEIIEAAEEK